MKTATQNTYNKYHTDVVYAYQLGILPDNILTRIPTSTRSNWKSRDLEGFLKTEDTEMFSNLVANFQYTARYQHLRVALAAMISVNKLLLKAFQSLAGHEKVLFNLRHEITRLVERYEQKIPRISLLRKLGIPRKRYEYWTRTTKKCASTLAELCRLKHPHQLTPKEINTIRRYLNNEKYQNWPRSSIYFEMMENENGFCSISTFYAYAVWLGFKDRNFRKLRENKTGIRASRPGEILHADVTHTFFEDGSKAAVHVIMDNFSRFAFACVAAPNPSANIHKESLFKIFKGFPGLFKKQAVLLVDDGSENKGELQVLIDERPNLIRKLVAQKDILFSNSMVEALNKVLKNQYIRGFRFRNLEHLQEFLDEFKQEYNNRPHGALEGSRPANILNGELPDRFRFREARYKARMERIRLNTSFDCNSCSEELLQD